MRVGSLELGDVARGAPFVEEPVDRVRKFFEILPRPLRFLAVGAVGLLTDLSVFTMLTLHWPQPLLTRLVSLAVATLVTWRLNRALTFERSHRLQIEEAVRYAAVSATAQAASYVVFAALVLTILARLPQAAVLVGAVVGAGLSYNGHRLFAFRPHRPAAPAASDACPEPKAMPE
jgi:putative flippase GtrA